MQIPSHAYHVSSTPERSDTGGAGSTSASAAANVVPPAAIACFVRRRQVGGTACRDAAGLYRPDGGVNGNNASRPSPPAPAATVPERKMPTPLRPPSPPAAQPVMGLAASTMAGFVAGGIGGALWAAYHYLARSRAGAG